MHLSLYIISLWLCPLSVELSLSCLTVILSNLCKTQPVWCYYDYVHCLYNSACLITVCAKPHLSLFVHISPSSHLSLSALTVIVSKLFVQLIPSSLTFIAATVCTTQPVWSHCDCVHCLYNSACLVTRLLGPLSAYCTSACLVSL